MFPDIKRRMAFLIHTWVRHKDENGGLLPPTAKPENEQIDGHTVSLHFYALAGIRCAAGMARALGMESLAAKWDGFYSAFHEAVFARLDVLLKETDGVITPSFEGFEAKSTLQRIPGTRRSRRLAGPYGKTGGFDWLNIAAVYPTETIDPMHRWITSSISRWGNTYVEGLLPYPEEGDFASLHTALTLTLAETWLRRGDYAETIRDLYGVLLHTSRGNAMPGIADSSRRLDKDTMPSTLAAARLVRFLRNCLAYEEGGRRLHLLGGFSPAWMKDGAVIALRNAPTELGAISFRTRMRIAALDMELEFHPRPQAESIILHLPPFLKETRVKVDDTHAEQAHGGWLVPLNAKNIRVWWRDEPLPDISYEAVVRAYLDDYEKRTQATTLF